MGHIELHDEDSNIVYTRGRLVDKRIEVICWSQEDGDISFTLIIINMLGLFYLWGPSEKYIMWKLLI